jgi:hypothetical protein
MNRVPMLWAALVVSSCAMSHDVGGEATSLLLPIALDAECRKELEDSTSDLPEHLRCTGLYEDIKAGQIAEGVLPYVPATRLWSDGLNKARYIYLPKGTQIDASNPDAWKFPIGTRFWKEFQEPGTDKPIETRIYYKKDEGEWKQSTYEWSQDLSDAKRVRLAKDVTLGNGQSHWLPGPSDCEDCHKGRRDRVLGFEQVALGLPEASGETLSQLAANDLLKNFDGATEYHIGPDDDAVEAKALGWMHMNCGVTCHNENPNGGGQSLDMRLIMKAEDLDGRPLDMFPAARTTMGSDTQTLRWLGRTRVVAGSPEDSWLFSLITYRNVGQEKEQMPPISTYVVDPEGSEWVRQWIANMAPAP